MAGGCPTRKQSISGNGYKCNQCMEWEETTGE